MTVRGSADVAFFLVDGYPLLGVSTELSDKAETVVQDTTPLGTAAETWGVTGRQRIELAQAGFYDDAVGGVHDALVGSNGLARIITLGYEGNVLGRRFIGFQGPLQMGYQRVAKGAELHKANATYQGSGARSEGLILHPLGAETAAAGPGAPNGIDNGASSANGGIGYLEVTALALDGATNGAFRVQHSVDNITYTNVVTFAGVTVAPSAQRVVVAGTINRYVQASWSFVGVGGASRSVTFMTGFVRNP